jgi:hypothetical protein
LEQNNQSRKWESKNLATLDIDTGEVLPGHTVHLPLRVRVGDHVSVMQEAARAVALDPEITPTAFRLLKYLESILDYENAIRVIQKEIANELDIAPAQINRAMKLLMKKGIVERIECPSLKPVYRLNPNYGWRGRHAQWNRERHKAPPLMLLKGGRDEEKTPERDKIACGID